MSLLLLSPPATGKWWQIKVCPGLGSGRPGGLSLRAMRLRSSRLYLSRVAEPWTSARTRSENRPKQGPRYQESELNLGCNCENGYSAGSAK